METDVTAAIGAQPEGTPFTVPPFRATHATSTSPALVPAGVGMVIALVAVALTVVEVAWRAIWAAPATIVHVRDAGVGSGFVALSVARTWKVWVVALKPE